MLKFHFLDHPIKTILRFGVKSVWDASPYKQLNTSIKASYCQTSKRYAMCMNEKVFGLDQMQSNVPKETSYKRNDFSTSVSNEEEPLHRKNGSYLRRQLWSVSLEVQRSELSLENNLCPESGNLGRLFKILF